MSVEQWAILALFVLLPLLEGVARLRRARVTDGRPRDDRVAQVPPAARRGAPLSNRHVSDTVFGAAETSVIPPPPSMPPLAKPASDAAVPLAPLRAGQTPVSRGPGSPDAQRRVPMPVSGDSVVQWLRPTRNLRRAIVAATILGPPQNEASSTSQLVDIRSQCPAQARSRSTTPHGNTVTTKG